MAQHLARLKTRYSFCTLFLCTTMCTPLMFYGKFPKFLVHVHAIGTRPLFPSRGLGTKLGMYSASKLEFDIMFIDLIFIVES